MKWQMFKKVDTFSKALKYFNFDFFENKLKFVKYIDYFIKYNYNIIVELILQKVDMNDLEIFT